MQGKFFLSDRSLKNLNGVHPHLLQLINCAIALTPVDFIITCGVRSIELQHQLVAAGKSLTMNSRHLTGHAVDVAAFVDNTVSWEWHNYEQIAWSFRQASINTGIPVEWGGDWKQFKDGPHFQLPFSDYPV